MFLKIKEFPLFMAGSYIPTITISVNSPNFGDGFQFVDDINIHHIPKMPDLIARFEKFKKLGMGISVCVR